MKIAVLSRGSNLYSTKRLMAAGKERGHSMHLIDTMRCYMNISKNNPTIHYKGKPLPDFDAVIPRIGASRTFYGCAVLRQFEAMGTFTVNSSVALSRSRDKLRSMQLLAAKGIELPVTTFGHTPDDIKDMLSLSGKHAPYVIKLLESTQGNGVVLADTDQSAKGMVEAFMAIDTNILVQEFIAEAGGADLRCFVVGGKCIAAMKRQGAPGEFRSNLHKGGSASLIELSSEEKKTAELAAKAMGLNIAGVDILQSKKGPMVLEVNSSPGIEGIENATKKDVAGIIIEYIEKQVEARREAKEAKESL